MEQVGISELIHVCVLVLGDYLLDDLLSTESKWHLMIVINFSPNMIPLYFIMI